MRIDDDVWWLIVDVRFIYNQLMWYKNHILNHIPISTKTTESLKKISRLFKCTLHIYFQLMYTYLDQKKKKAKTSFLSFRKKIIYFTQMVPALFIRRTEETKLRRERKIWECLRNTFWVFRSPNLGGKVLCYKSPLSVWCLIVFGIH
jgi:hypothetical protein